MTLWSNYRPLVRFELRVGTTSMKEACLVDGGETRQWVAHVVHTNASFRTADGNSLTNGSSPYCSSRDRKGTDWSSFQRDQFFWTARISKLIRCGQCAQALRIYADMQKIGITPSSYTFVAVLKACSRLQDLESAKQVHADIVQCGFQLDVYVGTMLVDVYAKCGSLVDARTVFDKMEHRDVVSWNAMISGYAQMERCQEALQLYAQMQQEGVVPDDHTFVGALKACSSLLSLEAGNEGDGEPVRQGCLDQVRSIHSQVVERGSEKQKFVGTMLVDVYAKSGNLGEARRVFDTMPCRDVVSWTAMILGYAHMAQAKEALQLFSQMQQEGVAPNDRTFVGALKACSNLANLDEGYVGAEKPDKEWCVQQVRAIHFDVMKSGSVSDVFVGTMLVDAYAKCGNLVDARHVFEKMPCRDTVSWNAMILGYTQMEEGELALDLYTRMEQEGVVPDDRTFVAGLKACGAVVGLEKGKEIHGQVMKRKLKHGDLFVQNALIDMYGKCGCMEIAQQLFDSLPAKDLVTWSVLIAGYACQGESERVFNLFTWMIRDGIQPDGITFLSVLAVCSHVGLVDKALRYFGAMRKDHGIIPSSEHYNCMIDLLGRAGQLDEAMDMVKAMPFEPPGKAWRSLLGACRKWSNVKLGRRAFDCAVRLDENDAAVYVLMSNIYATASMLEDAKEIQAMGVKAGACKKPGLSWWTDNRGLVHAFLAGDQEHAESHYVYLVLQYISLKIREGKEIYL